MNHLIDHIPMENGELSNAGDSPLVSIIIPVYNAEKYLCDSLDSALGQTYPSIEVIAVDDGSTDSSPEILSRYEAQYPALKVLTQRNSGQTAARRNGLEHAEGEYIQYLDSDDRFCSRDVIGNLVAMTRLGDGSRADMVVSPFFYVDGSFREKSFSIDRKNIGSWEYIGLMLEGKAYFALWVKFHRRSLYDDNIEYADISWGEDAILSAQLLARTRKIVCSQEPVIEYRLHESSITHRHDETTYRDFSLYVKWLEDFVSSNGKEQELDRELACFRIRNTMTMRSFGKLRDEDSGMSRVLCDLKKYPDIFETLSRHDQKIIRGYGISNLIGKVVLSYYKSKD